MRKIFTFLFAALMSVGMWAEPITVTWNSYDLPSSGSSFTKDGVTLTCDIDDDLYGPGTFTTDLGNFTQIVVSGDEACYIDATGGWSGNINQKTWTGNAASVSWGGGIYCYSSDVTIVFTIEPASTPEPEPATTVVTITDSDFPGWGDSFTKDGVTVSAEMIDDMYGNISGPGSFSTTLGNFTKIEVDASYVSSLGPGWSGNSEKMTWTGNASSVSFTGDINGDEEGLTLKFTIEPASTPEPAGEVTVVFAANNKTVERTVTLPHNFSCSYENKDGELDAIIKELYEISAGHCSDDNYPVASGNEAVTAGSNDFDNYITISAAFEGTATVSGWYWNSDAYDGDGDWMTYTLTISIKAGSETAVENVQIDKAQGTKILRDGMLLIEKNGKIYNVMGAEVK